jgi:hypothetical protein
MNQTMLQTLLWLVAGVTLMAFVGRRRKRKAMR